MLPPCHPKPIRMRLRQEKTPLDNRLSLAIRLERRTSDLALYCNGLRRTVCRLETPFHLQSMSIFLSGMAECSTLGTG